MTQMKTDSSWWARKMGNPSQQPQAPQAYVAPQNSPLPQNYPVQQQQQQIDPQQIRVTAENLYEAAAYWQGGEAHHKERTPCPQCGSGHYYSRSTGVSRGPAPAPMCYTCGFNGMFQQGDPAVWQAG